jgi:hypothetical protein
VAFQQPCSRPEWPRQSHGRFLRCQRREMTDMIPQIKAVARDVNSLPRDRQGRKASVLSGPSYFGRISFGLTVPEAATGRIRDPSPRAKPEFGFFFHCTAATRPGTTADGLKRETFHSLRPQKAGPHHDRLQTLLESASMSALDPWIHCPGHGQEGAKGISLRGGGGWLREHPGRCA